MLALLMAMELMTPDVGEADRIRLVEKHSEYYFEEYDEESKKWVPVADKEDCVRVKILPEPDVLVEVEANW